MPRSPSARAPMEPAHDRGGPDAAQWAREISRRLEKAYPGSARDLCALVHSNAYELLAATILSAQCTDARVNQVTPELFSEFPVPEALASAPLDRVEEIIRPTGFFRSKARSLVGMATALVDRFDGEVPRDLDDLVTIPGVGRKTANVVRSVAFGLPGLPVDTHVGRLARRLGLTTEVDPDKVERDLNALVPARVRGALSLRLILHGREVCSARRPRCGACILADRCPAVGVGSSNA
ncbi:MAG: endonuclease III [Actinomycetota bacterium]|nr:endonuclease III [Actinomycetota bacterium]